MATRSALNVSGLKFDVEETPSKTIVRCAGRIVLDNCAFFQNTIADLMSEHKCTVVDLGHVTYIDSSGLGALVNVWSSAKKRSAEVEILWGESHTSGSGPKMSNSAVGKLLHLTGLERLFGTSQRRE